MTVDDYLNKKNNNKLGVREKKFIPKCIYSNRPTAYTATGYIVPCCWVDSPTGWKDDTIKKFYNKKLHLDNIEHMDEIFTSEVWINWIKMMKENPEKAPLLCKRYCSSDIRDEVTKEDEWF